MPNAPSSVFDSAISWIKDRLAPSRERSSHRNDICELSQYQPMLLTRATRMTRDLPPRVSAEDLVQETLLEAHLNLDKFNGQTKLEMVKWLCRILSNNIADTYRSLKRKKRDIAREQPIRKVTNGSSFGGIQLASPDGTPSFYASNAEQEAQLAAAIGQLPEQQRAAVVMHHLQGETLASVAQKLGRSRSAVAGLVFRGLQTLKKAMVSSQ